ncbi:MAG: acyl-ACP desaturase [Myxococcota bacterium]
MGATRALKESIYREYMNFFELAEKNRRWSIFTDIPWDELDPTVFDEDGALCAETFVGVESYLPDYVSEGLNAVRERFGQAWFSANWGYEESKHALSLREYLVRSGQRTSEQMSAYEELILSRRWQIPFKTARQMTVYGAIQEQATLMMYRHQRGLAESRGDKVLARIYGFIGRDEAAHADFYRKVVRLELEEDRDGTVEDLAVVFREFRMPGVGLVPDYEERVEVMRKTGGVDRAAFFKEVWFPTLKKLGVTREEVTRASSRLRRVQSAA